MRRMKATLSSATFGYIGLLSCSMTISRFGRQARLGEHVDSGLTAYRHSEFATLDKMRLRYRTRLGRFITSPRRLAALRLPCCHLNFHSSFWGQTPCRVGPGPKKCVKKSLLFMYSLRLSLKWYKMRIRCGTFLSLPCFAYKRLDILA